MTDIGLIWVLMNFLLSLEQPICDYHVSQYRPLAVLQSAQVATTALEVDASLLWLLGDQKHAGVVGYVEQVGDELGSQEDQVVEVQHQHAFLLPDCNLSELCLLPVHGLALIVDVVI